MARDLLLAGCPVVEEAGVRVGVAVRAAIGGPAPADESKQSHLLLARTASLLLGRLLLASSFRQRDGQRPEAGHGGAIEGLDIQQLLFFEALGAEIVCPCAGEEPAAAGAQDRAAGLLLLLPRLHVVEREMEQVSRARDDRALAETID